ncbi:hypothetical protein BDR22DRAFT_639936 [Usnea florida]
MDNMNPKTSMIWATIWTISTFAALGDTLAAASSSRLSSTTNSSSSRIWSNSTSLPTSLTTTIQLSAASSQSISKPPLEVDYIRKKSTSIPASLSSTVQLPAPSANISSRQPLDVHLNDVSAHIWRNSTSLPASTTSTVQFPAPSANSSSRPPLDAHLDDPSVSSSPATLTKNAAGDIILTLSQDFANGIADRLSYGTCPAYDPKPSEPIIEKRQILARNPCAVARSKRGIASIGGGTSLFRSLFNLPRAFPNLVSPLDIDVQDIASYVKLDLPSWSLAPEGAINATAELFYLMTLKHEMNIGGSITVNTILHYDIAQSATRLRAHRQQQHQFRARPNYATPQQAQRRVELVPTTNASVVPRNPTRSTLSNRPKGGP